MTEYDFTPEGFRAWLTSHPPDEIAGWTCTDRKCPARRFWNYIYADDESFMLEEDATRSFLWKRESTDWIETFASTIDARYGEPTGPSAMIKPVTYAQCLGVLASINLEHCATMEEVEK